MTRVSTLAPPALALAALLAALPAPAQQAAPEGEAPAPGRAGGHGRDYFIASYDRDGDGAVTLAEYGAVRDERFAGADADGDGHLNEAEYVAEFEGRLKLQYAEQGRDQDAFWDRAIQQAHVRHAVVDRDRDGLLSAEEQAMVAEDTFARVDTNGDGVVSTDDPLPPPPADAPEAAPEAGASN